MTNVYLTGGDSEVLFRRVRPVPPTAERRAPSVVLPTPAAEAPPVKLPTARAPLGGRIYAIGDIHGRADLLDAMLNQIAADVKEKPPIAKPTLVFLGDYVDRGRQSRDVIARLLAIPNAEYEAHFIRGNHDRALLTFIQDPLTGPAWLNLGGAETIRSYGVKAPFAEASERQWRFAANALHAAMPPEHLKFLGDLPLFVRIGEYLFVHAGLRPGLPLHKQTEEDMLEIREPFLKKRARWPFVIVHGHSPVATARRLPAGIALDTGAYATGKLSAARLDGETISFLST